MNIRIAGFGGQGIVMAGYALGQAGILDGRNALQTQSYGSESRGGACKSDVIISEQEILELAPSALDVLVAMAQPALDKFLPSLKEDGTLIYESNLVKPGDRGRSAFGLPATQIAEKTFGREVVANVIMLGYLAGLTGAVSRESLRKAISESVPPKTVDMNLAAFDEGFKSGAKCGDGPPRPDADKRRYPVGERLVGTGSIASASLVPPRIASPPMRSGHDSFSRRGNPYYDDLFSEITNLSFGHKVFGAGPALIGRDRTLTKYVGQSFDPAQDQLDPEAWTHEHCDVCNYCINPGYTYWENEDGDDLCDVCYEVYVARQR